MSASGITPRTKAIIAVHADNKILGVGILWFIGAAVGVCVFRILQCKKPSGPYWLALSLFALGLGVDILSTFRQYTKDAVILVSSYAIYSLSIHCCGLAILFFQESEALKRKYWGCDGGHFIRGLLVVHVFLVALYVLQMQKWDVKNSFGQTPSLEMQSTMAYVPGFWHMVSQGRI